MHQIDNPFEEQKALGRLPQPSSNDDAVKISGPQGQFNFGFGRLLRSDQAGFHVEPEFAHTRDLRLDIGADKLRRELRHWRGSSPMASTAVGVIITSGRAEQAVIGTAWCSWRPCSITNVLKQ